MLYLASWGMAGLESGGGRSAPHALTAHYMRFCSLATSPERAVPARYQRLTRRVRMIGDDSFEKVMQNAEPNPVEYQMIAHDFSTVATKKVRRVLRRRS